MRIMCNFHHLQRYWTISPVHIHKRYSAHHIYLTTHTHHTIYNTYTTNTHARTHISHKDNTSKFTCLHVSCWSCAMGRAKVIAAANCHHLDYFQVQTEVVSQTMVACQTCANCMQ